MPRLPLFLSALTVAAIGAATVRAVADKVDYQKIADAASWEWQPEQATVLSSMMLCPKDYKVEIIRPQNTFGELTIQFYHDDRLDCTINGHAYTTFVIDEDILYYADYSHSTTGCALVAYDMKARKQLWKSDLEGIGPIEHFGYSNEVIVQLAQGSSLAPRTIQVRGNERAGKYLEFVDAKTGKSVAHRLFEKGFKNE